MTNKTEQKKRKIESFFDRKHFEALPSLGRPRATYHEGGEGGRAAAGI